MCVISRVEHQLGPLLPDRLYSTAHLGSSLLSLLFNLLSLLHSVRLFPAWGPLLMSLLDIQNRPTKARRRCRTSQVNRTESISSQYNEIRLDHPVQIHTHTVPHQCMHTYTSRSDSERGRKGGTFSLHHASSVFTDSRGSEAVWDDMASPSSITKAQTQVVR